MVLSDSYLLFRFGCTIKINRWSSLCNSPRLMCFINSCKISKIKMAYLFVCNVSFQTFARSL